MKSAAKSKTKPAAAKPTPEADPFDLGTNPSEDFKSLVGLLSAYTQVGKRLDELQGIVNLALHAAADSVRDEHSDLQEREAALEAQMEQIVRAHPEWLADRKSIVTPCGTVKMTKSTALAADNEELSVQLLRRLMPNVAEFYLRVETSLNLEALAALDDEALAKLHVRRLTKDSFSATPVKVNLGKLVAATARKGGGK